MRGGAGIDRRPSSRHRPSAASYSQAEVLHGRFLERDLQGYGEDWHLYVYKVSDTYIFDLRIRFL